MKYKGRIRSNIGLGRRGVIDGVMAKFRAMTGAETAKSPDRLSTPGGARRDLTVCRMLNLWPENAETASTNRTADREPVLVASDSR